MDGLWASNFSLSQRLMSAGVISFACSASSFSQKYSAMIARLVPKNCSFLRVSLCMKRIRPGNWKNRADLAGVMRFASGITLGSKCGCAPGKKVSFGSARSIMVLSINGSLAYVRVSLVPNASEKGTMADPLRASCKAIEW